jgi:SAM-dependent methyltransferase
VSGGGIEAFLRHNADRVREAKLLVRNEFTGLDAHEQYFNAFSRLLKQDPLGRVPMLGTDQRDLFIPVIRSAIAEGFERAGHVLDVGCGDGQTFSLFADAIPVGSSVDAFDPNPDYVEQFKKRVTHGRRFVLRHCETAGVGKAGALEKAIGKERGYELITVIHSLYFFDNLEDTLVDITTRLAPGGAAVFVFADELKAYTGLCVRGWLDRTGNRAGSAAHEKACRARLAVFAAASGGLEARLGEYGIGVRVTVDRQPSRLYGHTLADIIALSNLTGLSEAPDLQKFGIAANLVEKAPEAIGLRIETEGPRAGMFSVSQPQVVVTVRRARQGGTALASALRRTMVQGMGEGGGA